LRGVPEQVTWKDDRIFVKLSNMNMPLPKSECERLFGREPRNSHEAMLWGMRLRRRKVPISFSNIRCAGQADAPSRKDELARRKRKEVNQVKVEMNDVVMDTDKDGCEYPFPTLEELGKVVLEMDVNDTIVGHEPPKQDEDKSRGSIKLNLGGKAAKLESAAKQKSVLTKIETIKEKLHIKTFKTAFSDQ
jgi:hypothetical protein